MDLADLTASKEDLLLSTSLNEVRAKAQKRELAPTGYCHNCEEPIKEGLFCCADCRDEWQHRMECLKRSGRL